MNKMQEQVKEFHEAFELVIKDKPTYPTEQLAVLRARLINEEGIEFFKALGASLNSTGDMVVDARLSEGLPNITKELADMLYVIFGFFVSVGVDAEKVFDEVHRSNMSKVGGVKDEFGKLIKPPTYSKADVETVLKEQGYELIQVQEDIPNIPSYSV